MKKQRMTIYDFWKQKRCFQKERARIYNESEQKMKLVIEHKSSVLIKYPQYKKAFDYVSSRFPDIPVMNISIYKCDSSYLKRIGLGGIGGCYNCHLRTIIIADRYRHNDCNNSDDLWRSVKASVTIDEIIVHELLHYVSLFNSGGRIISSEIEEEFAYGNSLEYLRQKGHSDDDIILNNFLPYFISIVDQRKIIKNVFKKYGYSDSDVLKLSCDSKKIKNILQKYEKEIFQKSKEQAIERAKRVIECFSGDNKKRDPSSDESTFDMIDL
ncbi:MAG: hypothetical protein ACOC5T_06840 [Elusimicrobiota bacterium]